MFIYNGKAKLIIIFLAFVCIAIPLGNYVYLESTENDIVLSTDSHAPNDDELLERLKYDVERHMLLRLERGWQLSDRFRYGGGRGGSCLSILGIAVAAMMILWNQDETAEYWYFVVVLKKPDNRNPLEPFVKILWFIYTDKHYTNCVGCAVAYGTKEPSAYYRYRQAA